MSLFARLLGINAILCVGLAAQWGLNRHVRAGADLVYPRIRTPISQIDLDSTSSAEKSAPGPQFGWTEKSSPEAVEEVRSKLPFVPDDLLYRYYFRGDSPDLLTVYMVYSRAAADRMHHPEVCIRDVMGATEDLSARKIIFVDEEKTQPIQRFRFETGARPTTVYYWHFTFPRIPREGESAAQVMYQSISQPAPSVTVQITTTASSADLEAIEKGFLVHLNQLLRRRHLPEGAIMACDRWPITLNRR